MVEAGKSYFCTSLTRTLILDSCKETQTFWGTLRFLSSRRATLSRQISALATESPGEEVPFASTELSFVVAHEQDSKNDQ